MGGSLVHFEFLVFRGSLVDRRFGYPKMGSSSSEKRTAPPERKTQQIDGPPPVPQIPNSDPPPKSERTKKTLRRNVGKPQVEKSTKNEPKHRKENGGKKSSLSRQRRKPKKKDAAKPNSPSCKPTPAKKNFEPPPGTKPTTQGGPRKEPSNS